MKTSLSVPGQTVIQGAFPCFKPRSFKIDFFPIQLVEQIRSSENSFDSVIILGFKNRAHANRCLYKTTEITGIDAAKLEALKAENPHLFYVAISHNQLNKTFDLNNLPNTTSDELNLADFTYRTDQVVPWITQEDEEAYAAFLIEHIKTLEELFQATPSSNDTIYSIIIKILNAYENLLLIHHNPQILLGFLKHQQTYEEKSIRLFHPLPKETVLDSLGKFNAIFTKYENDETQIDILTACYETLSSYNIPTLMSRHRNIAESYFETQLNVAIYLEKNNRLDKAADIYKDILENSWGFSKPKIIEISFRLAECCSKNPLKQVDPEEMINLYCIILRIIDQNGLKACFLRSVLSQSQIERALRELFGYLRQTSDALRTEEICNKIRALHENNSRVCMIASREIALRYMMHIPIVRLPSDYTIANLLRFIEHTLQLVLSEDSDQLADIEKEAIQEDMKRIPNFDSQENPQQSFSQLLYAKFKAQNVISEDEKTKLQTLPNKTVEEHCIERLIENDPNKLKENAHYFRYHLTFTPTYLLPEIYKVIYHYLSKTNEGFEPSILHNYYQKLTPAHIEHCAIKVISVRQDMLAEEIMAFFRYTPEFARGRSIPQYCVNDFITKLFASPGTFAEGLAPTPEQQIQMLALMDSVTNRELKQQALWQALCPTDGENCSFFSKFLKGAPGMPTIIYDKLTAESKGDKRKGVGAVPLYIDNATRKILLRCTDTQTQEKYKAFYDPLKPVAASSSSVSLWSTQLNLDAPRLVGESLLEENAGF